MVRQMPNKIRSNNVIDNQDYQGRDGEPEAQNPVSRLA
jgi:hypothetical protein